MAPVITLLTDFGTRDHYVASMKGVILGRCPEAALVDISHEVGPQDIYEAAYLLSCCWRDFPPGTVHLAVVDPGVGGDRRPLALSAAGYYLVGPDNGIFTHIVRDTVGWIAREIADQELFRQPQSAVFHGRDIFASAAAALACGYPFEQIGPLIEAPILLDLTEVEISDNLIRATVIHVDRFGNLITNVRFTHLRTAGIVPEGMTIQISGEQITGFTDHYSGGPVDHPFALFGSGGYLEVAVKSGSAAVLLGTRKGDEVRIKY